MKSLNHDMQLFFDGSLGKIRAPFLKCPLCRKNRQFTQFDIDVYGGHGYLEGDYARAYRCDKCHILIVKKENELKEVKDGKTEEK